MQCTNCTQESDTWLRYVLPGLQLDLGSCLQPPKEFKVSTLLVFLKYAVSVTKSRIILSITTVNEFHLV